MIEKDASGLAQAVREGHLSAFELVQETIERAEEVNPTINAISSRRYEEALKEAQERDLTDLPFAGVPIFLKDLGQEQAGQVSTAGSRLFRSVVSKQSDNYVKALEKLGFIVLGRTNTPEFGFKNISDSLLQGKVNLPDDISRNAGGSSGGAAALLSAGAVSLAPASDGGGSIRIPASFNGLIGLKPTRGRIPVGPDSFRGWQGASVNFALTKSVRDTRRLLYYFQTCQMESPFILPELSYQSLFMAKNKPLTIAVQTESPIGGEVSADAIAAVEAAAHFLEKAGHKIVYLDKQIIDGVEAMKTYYLMNSVETAAMFDKIEAAFGREMTLLDMELMTWAIFQSGQKIPAKDYSAALSKWDQYSHQMAVFHETYDLLLTPTTAGPAPKHDQFLLSDDLQQKLIQMAEFDQQEQQELIWEMFSESLDWTPYTQQANLTGQPSISLPTYRNEQGLSLGIQLTAAKGREDLLLQIAELFEKEGQFK
ncbi:amidase [Streptococcus loxodontisalivarius]|uniref:Amidase n=1 Tax=Streptococcus loxodontisalivarius TaxID=1349415 RepID=A0ABS2PPH0_9STRE|nr:amidase [Streptococcus loxodontisalivarius]MBM7641786.1 amidase [Streptococcus loxodontisalivarius]